MCGLAKGNIAYHLKSETFKSSYFGGMVRQQLYTTQPQVMKNLRAHSVVAIYSVTGFETRFAFTDVFFLHYGISAQLIHEIKTVFALPQVENDPSTRGRDLFQCCVQLKSRVVNQGPKHVAGNIRGVYSNQDRIFGADLAHNHCQVHVAVDDVFISHRATASVNCRHVSFNRAPHQRLFTDAVFHEVCDRDHFQIMITGKLLQLRQPGHGSVFVHDLANYSRGIQTADTRYVNTRFSLTRTHEHAALFRT